MAATRTLEYSAFEPVLYLAFELSNAHWKLGFTTGLGRRPRQRSINAGDLEALQQGIHRARKRFDRPKSSRVLSCYEAWRDGFSLKGRRDGVAASLPGGARDREPGGGQLKHRQVPQHYIGGEPAGPTRVATSLGEDGPDGRGEATAAADPLPHLIKAQEAEAIGQYQIQAAIAAEHARAETPEETYWHRIALLYGLLARITPSAVVELNRAVAVAMALGPEYGLAIMDRQELAEELADYRWLHSARAELLQRLGRNEAAALAFRHALELAQNASERAHLLKRLKAVEMDAGLDEPRLPS